MGAEKTTNLLNICLITQSWQLGFAPYAVHRRVVVVLCLVHDGRGFPRHAGVGIRHARVVGVPPRGVGMDAAQGVVGTW
jgi:hypothetical protein